MVKPIELIYRDDEPRPQDAEKQQTHSLVAIEVNETEGDISDIEDQNEDNGEEEDDVDDEDNGYEEEEDDDDSVEDDEGKKGNKRKYYLIRNGDLKLFDCAICHQQAYPAIYLCEKEHIACGMCNHNSSSKCIACPPSTSYKRCRVFQRIFERILQISEIWV